MTVATFWAGSTMPALDRACLASFGVGGHPVLLFSFDDIADLPDGVTRCDAGEVVDPSTLNAFIYDGRPNFSHFSDYFRYRLFARTGQTWVDTDMLLLRPIEAAPGTSIFAKETARGICGAIMRIEQSDTRLAELLRRTEALMNTELVWGATGPRLLNQVLGADTVLRQARPAREFFPVHYDMFFKPLLPEYAEECHELCAGAYTLHLWNNIVVSLGYWKEMAPPRGSFLWSALNERGLLGLFRDTYPVEVMRNMVTNWRLRKDGGDIGVLKLARQIGPSIKRTTMPRLHAILQGMA